MEHAVIASRKGRFLAVVAVALVFAGPVATPRAARAEGVRYRDLVFSSVQATTGIVYGAALNNFGATQDLVLDLYQPEGDSAAARPVLIWVHGGGFKIGDRTGYTANAIEFARRGYVTASIDYRMRPNGTPGSMSNQDLLVASVTDEPTMISDARHDLQAAVRWFRANAETLRIDTSKIAVAGGSAGAIMALGANFRSDDPGDSGNPGYDSNIAAALSISGAWRATDIDVGEGPIYMFHGTNDTTVPFPLAVETCVGQTAMTNVCEISVNEGGGHGGDSVGMREEIADFLCRRVVGCS